jgi:hypothetical protein
MNRHGYAGLDFETTLRELPIKQLMTLETYIPPRVA